MADDTHPHKFGSNQTDQFRKQHRNRKSDYQSQNTAQKILRKKHDKELTSPHSHHQIDTKLFSAALHLIFTGKINQEKQNSQCHPIENRNHQQQFIYRITFHFRKKDHHILFGERKDDIKSNNGNDQ